MNAPKSHSVHDVDVEMIVPKGRPVQDVNVEMDVPMGRPVHDVDVEMNVPIGRPVHDVDVEMNVPIMGRPVGTTAEAGFDTSTGRPNVSNASINSSVENNSNSNPEDPESFIEDNLSLLIEYMKQYDLPTAWNTNSLSLNDDLLVRAKKRIGQQVRFDAKPLGIGMCYCCGSVLWSRVDNSHTRLVNLDAEDNNTGNSLPVCHGN